MTIEALIVGGYFYWKKPESLYRALALVFMTNACTHSVVIFILMKTGTYLTAILIAESFAWLSESYIYRCKLLPNKWGEPLALSSIANLASWQLGPLLTLKLMQLF